MIMIDSKAGQRLARAASALRERQKREFPTAKQDGDKKSYGQLRAEYMAASALLADELIADGHADAEDYS